MMMMMEVLASPLVGDLVGHGALNGGSEINQPALPNVTRRADDDSSRRNTNGLDVESAPSQQHGPVTNKQTIGYPEAAIRPARHGNEST
jgi:hypothetical protein